MAEGSAQRVQLFEMKALAILHKRLLEEKACRELLTSLLPFDPADKYAEYEGALKSAVRLGLMGEALTGQVQHKFNTVKDRVEARANLKRGVEIGDKAMILGALAKGDALAKEWGDVLGPELREAAKTAVATIALEETLQADLKSALRNGGPSGPVGSLDTSTIDVAALDRVIKDAASGRTNVTTIVGRQLIASCNAIRSLRLALLSGDWPSIESTVAAADAMRVAGTLSPEAEGEVRKAGAEIADRRVQRVIALALASGGAKGAVGSLDFRSADPDGLRAAVLQARSQADAIGGLSAPAEHLLKCAELVARLRAALRDVHWGALKIVVAEALEVRLPEPCIPEVATAKDELDNHHLVHHLTDAVERGGPVGTVARLDVSTVDTAYLSERIAAAEEMGPKTLHATVLLKLAKLLRRLRTELLAGNLAALPPLARQAASLPKEFIPPTMATELLVLQYEGENAVLCAGLREAMDGGAARGPVGAVRRDAISTAGLRSALAQAGSLKCRSDEALWLYEVAEALLSARDCFKASQWNELNECILEVQAYNKAEPSRARHAAPLGDPAPVLRGMEGASGPAAAVHGPQAQRGGRAGGRGQRAAPQRLGGRGAAPRPPPRAVHQLPGEPVPAGEPGRRRRQIRHRHFRRRRGWG